MRTKTHGKKRKEGRRKKGGNGKREKMQMNRPWGDYLKAETCTAERGGKRDAWGKSEENPQDAGTGNSERRPLCR